MKLEEKLFGRLCVCVCVCFPATLLIKDGRMTRGSSWSGCWVRWSRHYLFIRWHFFFWERESFPLSAMYLPQYIGESWRHSRTCWTFSFVPLMRWPKLGGGGRFFGQMLTDLCLSSDLSSSSFVWRRQRWHRGLSTIYHHLLAQSAEAGPFSAQSTYNTATEYMVRGGGKERPSLVSLHKS